jgi:hypothetical protein
MRRGSFGEARAADGAGHLLLDHALMEVLSISDAGMAVAVVGGGGQDGLPTPSAIRVRVPSLHGIGQRGSTEP